MLKLPKAMLPDRQDIRGKTLIDRDPHQLLRVLMYTASPSLSNPGRSSATEKSERGLPRFMQIDHDSSTWRKVEHTGLPIMALTISLNLAVRLQLLVHAILGVRPPAENLVPGSDSQDRMNQEALCSIEVKAALTPPFSKEAVVATIDPLSGTNAYFFTGRPASDPFSTGTVPGRKEIRAQPC